LKSGVNVITVTAKDVAGESGTDTLTITYNPPDDSTDNLSGMKMWEGKWLRATIARRDAHRSTTTAYLKILSWDPTVRALRTSLYSPSGRNRGSWDLTQLQLCYTSGNPLRFLFSFDYLGFFGFSGSLSGTVDSSKALVSAKLRAQGIYLSIEEDDDRESADNEEEGEINRNTVTMTGKWIPDFLVPPQIQNQSMGGK
jgi:hypothetical protein